MQDPECLDRRHRIEEGDQVGSARRGDARQLGLEVSLYLSGEDGPESGLNRDQCWFVEHPTLHSSVHGPEGAAGTDSEVDEESESFLVVGSVRGVGFEDILVLFHVSLGYLGSEVVDAREVAEEGRRGDAGSPRYLRCSRSLVAVHEYLEGSFENCVHAPFASSVPEVVCGFGLGHVCQFSNSIRNYWDFNFHFMTFGSTIPIVQVERTALV